MAGAPIHAQMMQAPSQRPAPRQFREKELIFFTVKIKETGQRFAGLVPNGTNIEDGICMVMRQNGGTVIKKYHETLGAHEIVEIRVGNTILKKGDKGIHWFLNENGIPIAVDEKGNIKKFLNGEEIKADRENNAVALGMESSIEDPKSTAELGRSGLGNE
ncbi:hypothetical protein H0O02_00125, partial [Candidatus Micrarchaeota archaeon]|nr:hypothetical protein [Candidatus Micrarchaeota archaeon]